MDEEPVVRNLQPKLQIKDVKPTIEIEKPVMNKQTPDIQVKDENPSVLLEFEETEAKIELKQKKVKKYASKLQETQSMKELEQKEI